MIWLALVSLLLAALPTVMIAINLSQFQQLPIAEATPPPISVLIPARNEAANIAACIGSVLANTGVEFEVIILDDASIDGTAQIVAGLAAADPRVRLATAPPLPSGWNGKQHACQVLSTLASHGMLLWIDADVQLSPDCLARVAAAMARWPNLGLLSGFPCQINSNWLDTLLLPLMYFVLLGYLPLSRMRKSLDPSLGAGNGQFMVARRDAYESAGGHAAIKNSRHDGIQLPRAFRRAGQSTDIFDATNVATCRMYPTSRATWRGLLKNADEGMATPAAIGPWTILLAGGSVVPMALTIFAISSHGSHFLLCLSVAAWILATAARLMLAKRFKQSMLNAIAHPFGVITLLMIQWQALWMHVRGGVVDWKGRAST